MQEAGLLFWLSFNVIASFVLNLVIAVILENYGNPSTTRSARCRRRRCSTIGRRGAPRPRRLGQHPVEQLHLLRSVRAPLGFRRPDGTIISRDLQLIFMGELRVHDHGGKINFQVLLALTLHAHSHGAFKDTAAADGSDVPEDYAIQLKITRQLRQAFRAVHARPRAARCAHAGRAACGAHPAGGMASAQERATRRAHAPPDAPPAPLLDRRASPLVRAPPLEIAGGASPVRSPARPTPSAAAAPG